MAKVMKSAPDDFKIHFGASRIVSENVRHLEAAKRKRRDAAQAAHRDMLMRA
jgi:hypothetical protein